MTRYICPDCGAGGAGQKGPYLCHICNHRVEMAPLKIGYEPCWLHGEHYRIATVRKIEGPRMLVHGQTSTYWINIKTVMDRRDEVPRSGG